MKRILIASIVGAVILFFYQFLSWEVLPLHNNSFKHVKDQDTVMGYLSKHFSEDGVYAMPMPAEGSDMKAKEEFMKKYDKKPEAIVYYNTSLAGDNPMVMVAGFLIDLVLVLIISIIISKTAGSVGSFLGRLLVVFSFALFVIFQEHLMNANWFHTPSHFINTEIMNLIIAWLITGIWLAWYMGRRGKAAAN